MRAVPDEIETREEKRRPIFARKWGGGSRRFLRARAPLLGASVEAQAQHRTHDRPRLVSTPHRSTIGCATIARLAAALLWVEGWVQRKTSPKTRRNANFEVETDHRRTGPRPLFSLRRSTLRPVPLDPPSPSIAPRTDTLRRERPADQPRLQLAGIERRLYRSGCLRFLGCIHPRRDGKSG
jgi:hypothetical protein